MPEYSNLLEANIVRQKEWDPGKAITPSYRGNELAGEVGEACNVIKKLERERLGIAGSRDTVEHLAQELADVVICVNLVAIAYGINIDKEVALKFNSTTDKMKLQTRMVVPN